MRRGEGRGGRRRRRRRRPSQLELEGGWGWGCMRVPMQWCHVLVWRWRGMEARERRALLGANDVSVLPPFPLLNLLL